jgi:hypothetical protein
MTPSRSVGNLKEGANTNSAYAIGIRESEYSALFLSA